jgi:competence protein ComEC
MNLVLLTLAWGAGVLLGRYAPSGRSWPIGLALAALALGILYRWRGKSWLGLALALALLAGLGRYTLAKPDLGPGSLAALNDSPGPVQIEGYVVAEPSLRSTYTQIEVRAERAAPEGQPWQPVQGTVLLNLPSYPVYRYGDRLTLLGQLLTPPSSGDYNYREYLAQRGVHSLLWRPQVQRLPVRAGSPLLRALYAVKERARRALATSLPDPEAGLLAGILLGLGHTLPEALADAFRATGLTHIIVISGFNMSLVLQAVMLGSRRWLHRWLALGLSMGAVLLYTLFVGPSPPVVRAALMGGLFVLAQLVGRAPHALTSLAAASWLMTLVNPLLLWSVSFQLSLVATLALVLVEPLLRRDLLVALTKRWTLDRARQGVAIARELFLATLAAQLLTLPIIWASFGEISLIALLANVLVLPAQPAVMAFGFPTLLLGLAAEPLGQVAGWLVWPFLRYTLWVVETLGRLPWAMVRWPEPAPAAVWLFYSCVLSAVLLRQKMSWQGAWQWLRAHLTARPGQRPLWPLGALALGCVLVWSAALTLPDGRLHIYGLDVGQGDALLIRAPDGQTVLVDGGPDPVLLAAQLGHTLPFWQRKLDLVVATHSDSDHLAGLIPLVERYHVGQVLQPARMDGGALSEPWQQALEARSVPVITATRGMRILVGPSVMLEVLNPPDSGPGATPRDDNSGSVVLRASMGTFQALLTADIDAQAESELLAAGLITPVTLLKVSHHGAATATNDAFLEASVPQFALISVGADNRFGHPAPAVLDRLQARGSALFRTDTQGTVEWRTDGSVVWVKPARRGASAP